MSVLDRAIIRAFNRNVSPDLAPVEKPTPEPELPNTAERPEASEPALELVEAMCGGQVYRIDQAHPAWTDKFPQPHIQLIPASNGADLSFASPYHEISPPVFPDLPQAVETDQDLEQEMAEVRPAYANEVGEAAEETEELTSLAKSEESPQHDESCDQVPLPCELQEPPQLTTVEPEPGPSASDAAASLQPAAALKIPATLKLPEVFQPPAEESQDEPTIGEAAEFSPDWEVDRFAWPPICQELLEAQSHYFEHVGSRLMAATQESDHVIMISGSRRGEGRSTLAMCLAQCAAQAGIKVALVDADLENPQLGTRLGMESPCSWLAVVSGHAPLQEAAVASIEDQLTLFPLTGDETAEVQPGDGRLVMFVRRVSAHYPLVIMDTGPLGSDGTHLFDSEAACPIDTAIVVRDLRNTAEQGALETAGRLQHGGIQAVGIAENFRTTQ